MVGQGGARQEGMVSGTAVGAEGMKSGQIRECHGSVKSGPEVRVSVGSGHRASLSLRAVLGWQACSWKEAQVLDSGAWWCGR